jgi:hypothetical protein
MKLRVSVSEWQNSSEWSRYPTGTKLRHIVHDSVTCVQRIEPDGTKHYEYFNSVNNKITDFTSPQMQSVEKILYFIQNEEKFFDVVEEGK